MSDIMRTIPLRTLLRETRKVKRMVRPGKPVLVTDRGEPLWILHSASDAHAAEIERQQAIDEILDEVLRERPSNISAARFLEESRR